MLLNVCAIVAAAVSNVKIEAAVYVLYVVNAVSNICAERRNRCRSRRRRGCRLWCRGRSRLRGRSRHCCLGNFKTAYITSKACAALFHFYIKNTVIYHNLCNICSRVCRSKIAAVNAFNYISCSESIVPRAIVNFDFVSSVR